MLEEGTTAPEFTLVDENEESHALSDYRGRPIVLYFYPRDDTSGCTKEACSFRDDYSAYEEADITVIGVSPDTAKSHTKFKNKYDLPFTLLADTDHQVADAYGVWGPKKFMGREYEGIHRTTFLIDGEGEIIKVFKNVKPANHSQQVLQVFRDRGIAI